jgi:hypothetical protein
MRSARWLSSHGLRPLEAPLGFELLFGPDRSDTHEERLADLSPEKGNVSSFQIIRAPHAACCVSPSAGRTKGGGGERGPLSGHTGEGRRGEGQGVEEGQRIHSVMRI